MPCVARLPLPASSECALYANWLGHPCRLTTRGPNTRATVTIQQPHPPTGSSSQTNSLEDSDYPSESYSEYDDSHWGDDEDDVGPSDSASISNDGVAYHHVPPRRSHRVVPANHWRDQQSPAPAHPHHPPPNVDPEADYRGGWGRAYPQQHQPRHPRQQHQGYYNGGGGRGYPAGGHPNGGHVAPYNNMAAYANNGMVPFGQQQQYGGNPFGQGPGYFNGAGRGYDMMAYGGYYGDPAQYAIPASMQQYHRPPPASTPPENTSQAVTPVPKEDPEKIRLEAELAAMKAQEEKAKQAAKQAEIEAQIRKDAEEAFKRRMEDMRIAQEEARKEIERAKEEAERAVRERIEAEKKAEAERARQQAEALQRAEENARIKFEADQKAAEERRKREEEDRKRAEEAARIRLEAAIKAEEAAKAAAAQKAAEEAARIKQIEEDAKRKAEADAAAKAEKEKADAAAAAEAAEAAKKEQDRLKAMWQEEARKKAEEASKKKQEKAPIRFKDAVGRKFSFPFHLCQTWGVRYLRFSFILSTRKFDCWATDTNMTSREWKNSSSRPSSRLMCWARTCKRVITT